MYTGQGLMPILHRVTNSQCYLQQGSYLAIIASNEGKSYRFSMFTVASTQPVSWGSETTFLEKAINDLTLSVK